MRSDSPNDSPNAQEPGQDPDEEPSQEPQAGEQPAIDLVRAGLVFYGVMLAVGLVWRMGLYGEPILYASDEAAAQGVRWGQDLGLGVAAGVGVVLASHVFTEWTRMGEALARALAGTIGVMALPDLLLLAMASGLGEELLFRGALQPRVGLVWASLLFGCVHFVPRREFLPWTDLRDSRWLPVRCIVRVDGQPDRAGRRTHDRQWREPAAAGQALRHRRRGRSTRLITNDPPA